MIGQELGQTDLRRKDIFTIDQRVEVFVQLCLGSSHYLGVAVAKAAHADASYEVEVRLAVCIVEVRALGLFDFEQEGDIARLCEVSQEKLSLVGHLVWVCSNRC